MKTPTQKAASKSKKDQSDEIGVEQLLLDSIIPYQINRLSHRMNKLLDRDLKSEGLSISSWRVMAVLDFNTSVSVNELADYAMIEQSTLSRLLQRMETDGLIELRNSARDGRVRNIYLTEFGRTRYDAVREITLRHVRRVVSGFSQQERQHIMRFIKIMYENVDALDLGK